MRQDTPMRQTVGSQWRMVVLSVATFFGILSFIAMILIIGYLLFVQVKSDEMATNSHLPTDLDYGSVEEVYDHLRTQFDGYLSEEQLLDGLKKGLLEATDNPYSTYFNNNEAEDFNLILNHQLIGIGAELTITDNRPAIVTPLKGLPAERVGIQAKDIIVKIDDQDTAGMSLGEAISLITGDEDTDVTLTISREGFDTGLEFTITRQLITVPSVEYEIKEGIGIIDIRKFTINPGNDQHTIDLALEAAKTFKEAGVRGVILDMRFNPGGDLGSTRDISGLWLQSGEIVTRVGATGGPLEDLQAIGSDQPPLADIPLVILVNQGTASASEIVAAALRDHDIGTIVGQTTYGKDEVQNVLVLNAGGLIKFTAAHWYTPDGLSVEGGIEPNIEVEDDPETEVDEQLEKALQILQRSD